MNTIKKKIQRKKPVIGTFSHIGGTNIAEALGISQLDCFVIDSEHGPFSEETVMEMIRAAKLHDTGVFVRPRDGSRAAILRMLDIGADALIVPNIHTVEEVKKMVEYAKYYPVGRRGFAFARCAKYGFDERLQDVQGYFQHTNENTWLIPQCETAGALENIEKIVSIDGVDGIFIGPYDLSVALEAPAVFDTKEFKEAVQRIIRACKKENKLLMIYADNKEQAEEYFKQGFHVVIIGTDMGMYIRAMNQLASSIPFGD